MEDHSLFYECVATGRLPMLQGMVPHLYHMGSTTGPKMLFKHIFKKKEMKLGGAMLKGVWGELYEGNGN